MNEQYIIVGQNQNDDSYYAMFCNEKTILNGKTKLKAIRELLKVTK